MQGDLEEEKSDFAGLKVRVGKKIDKNKEGGVPNTEGRAGDIRKLLLARTAIPRNFHEDAGDRMPGSLSSLRTWFHS